MIKIKEKYVSGYGKVVYSDIAMKKVFDEVVKLCFDTSTFCGETACQSFEFLIKCQVVLPNIVDMIGFEISDE